MRVTVSMLLLACPMHNPRRNVASAILDPSHQLPAISSHGPLALAHTGPLNQVLCLEYCDGGTLMHAARCGAFRLPHGAPTPPSWPSRPGWPCPDPVPLYTSLLEVALALRYLHARRLVHCDIKADNVLLRSSNRDPRGWTCKVRRNTAACARGAGSHSSGVHRRTCHLLVCTCVLCMCSGLSAYDLNGCLPTVWTALRGRVQVHRFACQDAIPKAAHPALCRTAVGLRLRAHADRVRPGGAGRYGSGGGSAVLPYGDANRHACVHGPGELRQRYGGTCHHARIASRCICRAKHEAVYVLLIDIAEIGRF